MFLKEFGCDLIDVVNYMWNTGRIFSNICILIAYVFFFIASNNILFNVYPHYYDFIYCIC